MPLPRRSRTRMEFECFVERCADDLLNTAYLIVFDLGDAEDLAQETLLRVARRWPRVRRMDQPVAYARRILVNLALDDAKRRSRRRRELEPWLDAAPDGQADGVSACVFGALDARAELFGALAALPPRQRAVLVLRYFEDLSEAQTAHTLGCSLGTVKSTTSRGLARLRVVLDRRNGAAAENNGHTTSYAKEQSP
jgi:RNA polymerase sigma-70 factor (sigma-E family)